MKAVQFDGYGGPEVLVVREIEPPTAGPGRVVVRVKAAGINPGEIAIREGVFADRWPSTFPSGEGSDLAGVVEQVGAGVAAFAPGDEVLGWSDERSSHAELVAVPATQLTAKPAALPWEVAGALHVGPMAGWASVDVVAPQPGETVVIAGAAGGVGAVAAQLVRHRGATAIGLASERNHDWLRSRGIVPVAYGEGQEERIRAAAPGGRVDGLIDAFGCGYVDLALALGVPRERINTVIDFAAAGRLGVSARGSSEDADAGRLGQLAALLAEGGIELPIAATYPLEQVREAYAELAQRHTRGKRVLVP
jgi:NADPH:quinone reductase-like Zn-dependent oxidoreductase